MKKIIVIDPGHGGGDPGAVANGLLEKELNLSISRLLAEKLAPYETDVILTRQSDTPVSLKDRAETANRAKADFFLSIHCNAGGGEGFESYVHIAAPAATLTVREIIHREVSRFCADQDIADRGMKSADFAVLRLAKMPAVLLEMLFIDHPRDSELLRNSFFLNGLAAATAAGVSKALKLKLKPVPEQPPSAWDPRKEIEKLKDAGLIVSDHNPGDFVTWGELATVLNKMLKIK